ncbi:MAG: cytochrome b/b6 domain-containing protein [Proteobacteria bacterium]|jgi:Ni/Fe-hydrogenase 1 B-type cytochrome subunit|nr:cytochrome b/b6 domain-containing protein [Pseudomonadota bacterium]MCG6936094.1 cytochrome b/b6 domain-containing protein [Pseudomonadota bacterium]
MLKRTLIWTKSLRLAHWVMTFSVCGLLITGWFQTHVVSFFQLALDYHYILAYLLLFSLGIRLYSLFANPRSAAGWHDLLPSRSSLPGIGAMLRFYVSFGRTPLPQWYAHNPLWAPLYLLLFFLLLLQVISGFLIGAGHHTLIVNLYTLHDNVATLVGWFIFLHVLTVVAQELKGGLSDISAMIHGYRIFIIEKPEPDQAARKVSLDSIKQHNPH